MDTIFDVLPFEVKQHEIYDRLDVISRFMLARAFCHPVPLFSEDQFFSQHVHCLGQHPVSVLSYLAMFGLISKYDLNIAATAARHANKDVFKWTEAINYNSVGIQNRIIENAVLSENINFLSWIYRKYEPRLRKKYLTMYVIIHSAADIGFWPAMNIFCGRYSDSQQLYESLLLKAISNANMDLLHWLENFVKLKPCIKYFKINGYIKQFFLERLEQSDDSKYIKVKEWAIEHAPFLLNTNNI